MVRTLPPAAAGSTIPTEAKLLDAVAHVHEWLVSKYGDPTEWTSAYQITWHDENGWGDCESPVLLYEEGPYNWVFDAEVECNDVLANLYGYRVEAVCGWGALGFYRQ